MPASTSIDENNSADDVMKLLDSLDNEATTAGSGGSIPATSGTVSNAAGNKDDGDDIMGFLDSLTGSSADIKPTTTTTAPSVPSAPPATLKPKVEADLPQQLPQQQEPTYQGEEIHIPDPISSLTSWWSKNKGGLWDSAASAVKQAEAKVRELQPEVAHGQRAAIETLGDSFSKFKFDRQLLQSTLTSVLDTIAPPLSRHEQLQIHVFHDMVGYPAIDNIVHSVFERVMDQVEGGGDLALVVQKGKERNRLGSGTVEKRELGVFKGSLEQGQKLAAASIEEYLRGVKASEDEQEKAQQKLETPADADADNGKPETVVDEYGNVSINNPARNAHVPESRVSNIYLSIQPVSADPAVASDKTNLGAASSSVGLAGTTPAPTIISSSSPHAFQFIIYLTDPEHNIKFSTVSQSFPLQWAEWLDSPDSAFDTSSKDNTDSSSTSMPADPREWVIDWVEEGLGLSVGVVAQTYVSKRMGLSVLPPSRAPTPSVK